MPSLAQIKIEGLVQDKEANPLPGASIYLEGTYDGTSSDQSGKFSFVTSESGTQILVAEFIGFEAGRLEISLDSALTFFTFTLPEAFNEMEAVQIAAGAFEASDVKKAVMLKPLDIVTTAGATGDIVGALQTLPGTSTVGESGRLFVRGGSGDESKIFVDGTMAYSAFTSAAPNTAARGRFNPFLFKGTIFSTGGYSAEYGQAMSSVLLLNTLDIAEEERLDISIMSVGVDAGATEKWKTGSVTAHGGYYNLGPYQGLVKQNFDWEDPWQALDGSVSVRQKVGNEGLIKVYANINDSRFVMNQNNPSYDDQLLKVDLHNRYAFVNTSYSQYLGGAWNLRVGASVTDNLEEIGLNEDLLDKTELGGHAKIVVSNRPFDRLKISLGGEAFNHEISQNYATDSASFEAGFVDSKQAGFLETEFHLTSRIALRAGGRMEYSSLLNKVSMAPRVSGAISTGDHSQISLAYGIFHQDPSDDILLYQKDLEYQQAEHYIASFQVIQDLRTFRVEAYYKDYSNLMKLTSLDMSGYGNSGNGYAYGVDVFWRDKKTIEFGDYWVSYSWIKSERDFLDYPSASQPGFVSEHNFSFVYKHWISDWRSQVGGTVSFSSPRLYDDPNTPEFNDQETSAFRSINLNWSYLYRQDVIFHASVNNVFGFENVFGEVFSSSANGEGIYESAPIVQGAPRFFFVGCFLTFSRNKELNQLDKIN
jgi:hypothetical protein